MLDARIDRRPSPRDRRWRDDCGVVVKPILSWSPVTVIFTSPRADPAGPLSGSPASTENSLPWQSQFTVPSDTRQRAALRWVQTAENASDFPLAGLGDHDLVVGKIAPPPTSMSLVEVSPSARGHSTIPGRGGGGLARLLA